MSMRAFRAMQFRPVILPSSCALWLAGLLRRAGGGERVRPTIIARSRRGASHGFHDVGQAEGLARPGTGLHDPACPPRSADLQATGRRRSALEGDPGPGGLEEEG